MILHRDLAILEKALLDLYGCGLKIENYAGRSFALLERLLESESTALIVRDAAHANIDICLDHELPNLRQVGEVFGQLAPKYPWFRADPSIHNGQVHCRSDFCSDRQFRNLDIKSEVFRHWGHEHFMSMYVHSEKSRVVFFGFNKGKRDFSAKERTLAAMARPHLSTARHLALALETAKSHPLTPQMLNRFGFTPRESDVLYWLTEGKSNVEIASILHLQLSTVKGHIMAIFNKTGVGNRQAASLHAFELAKRNGPDPSAFSRNRASLFLPYELPPTKVG